MTDFLETTGKNEEEAIKIALETLGLSRDAVRIEVIHRAKTGFMGFGAKPAKVKIHYQRPEPQASEQESTLPLSSVTAPSSQEAEPPMPVSPVVETPVPVSPVVETPMPVSPVVEIPMPVSPVVAHPVAVIPVEEKPIQVNLVEENSVVANPIHETPLKEIPDENTEEVSTFQGSQVENLNQRTEKSSPVPEDASSLSTSNQWDALIEENKTITSEPRQFEKNRKSKKEKEFNLQEKEEISQATQQFLQGLVERLSVEVTIKIAFRGEVVIVNLEGEEVSSLIGRRGDTLDAIQQLTTYVVQKNCKKRLKVWIDAENYRAKREETLIKLAEKMAGQAVKHRRNVPMESMNAYERHIIHEALSDVPKVYTYSTGSEPNRRIVVAYQGNENQSKQGHKGKPKRRSHYDK